MMINPAGKYVIVHHASPAIEPSQQAGPSIREYFELNRPTCLKICFGLSARFAPTVLPAFQT